MRFTLDQEKYLTNFLKTNQDKKFSAKELAQAINNSLVVSPLSQIVNISAFSAALGRSPYKTRLGYTREKTKHGYLYSYNKQAVEQLTFTSWEKNKNLLVFKNTEKIELYFDFNTKKFNISPAFIQQTGYEDNEKAHTTDLIYNLCTNYPSEIKEWVFSYPTMWDSDIHNTLKIACDCEQGYINFIKENNLTICYNSYVRFQITKYMPKANKYILEGLSKFLTEALSEVYREYLFSNPVLLPLITKIIQKDSKNFHITANLSRQIRALLYNLVVLRIEDNNFSTVLDTNRGILYNIRMTDERVEYHRDALMSTRLQEINGINHFNIDNYEVIVPQGLADLQTEGKQQNNCVGFFYNDSVLQGKDYIYFLRKKKKPQHSYITCRFNILLSQTVERYYKNNLKIENPKELKIINEIDEKIKQILSTK